jgi:hypothetical protein
MLILYYWPGASAGNRRRGGYRLPIRPTHRCRHGLGVGTGIGGLGSRPSCWMRWSAGITKRLWEIGDIVDVLEAWESGCARG